MSDKPSELQESLAESFARDEASWQSWLSGNDDAEYDQLVKEAFLAGRDSLRSETNEIKTERDDQHKLIVRQANLLTAAVNALRGTPPDDTLWSHHDVAELADSLTAKLAAARAQIVALESHQRWRSVAEEKPPKDCLCLVAVPRHAEPLVDYWNGFVWLDWQPTHWMPLPDLPAKAEALAK